MEPSRPKPSAPPVYRPSQTCPQMSLTAPPVYRPQPQPRILQPKPAIPAQPGIPTAGLKPPTAPPVYRPPVYRPNQRPWAVQPKVAAVSRAVVVQLAKKEESESGFSSCDATVVGAAKSGEGSYSSSTGVHGEINALEDYLSNGGALGDIEKIVLTSQPCKYCHLVLSDLGVRLKVVAPGSGFGNCQGGSYGWFSSEGQVSKAAQTKTGKNQKDYITSVIARQRLL